MSKEYTGPEFEVEFARAWLKYVEGGKVGVDPRTQWEHKSGGVPRWSDHPIAQHPGFAEGVLYRWKLKQKRMVTIGYQNALNCWCTKELVAPEVEAPPIGEPFYVAGILKAYAVSGWTNGGADNEWFAAGLLFLTREDAQAMADWLATCRKGGQ
jgi:hypothetical protein